ncbi:cis-prenyltransferase 1, cis-prenyltransferase 3 [Hibiscus trionum]|uniref:Alkyl transferase n=1 Tax=Hibiscus trionum TaxID=183268 RepID=A0A9W7MRS4_HIBTR|nr:cis-prenyltransferase 1, cis-prenyltransferase 3 [Hibiscus trionum]
MGRINQIYGCLVSLLQKCIFRILSVGPIPNHIAFIMDGNRRYSKRLNSMEGDGHKAGFSALKAMLKYCYEFGVRYVTVYAFSIDNFKRNPEQVQSLMDLMLEKIEGVLKDESVFNRYGIRIIFSGNLGLLSEPVRSTAERAMLATAKNTTAIFSVCVAYTSTNEILHAVQKSCEEKWDEIAASDSSDQDEMHHRIKLTDIEKHMYMAAAPDPDIIIRTSGETRLSNFLLWQSANCYLYSPSALWPEIGFRQFLWGILNFQRIHFYLDKKRKQL